MKKGIKIILFLLLVSKNIYAQSEAFLYNRAIDQYSEGHSSTAISTCKEIKKLKGDYYLDASVLLGMCRENQGLDFFAKQIYKRAILSGSSVAATKLGQMMYRKGHLLEAERYAQQSIRMNITNAEAHMLLASVEVNNGSRLKAMLPLYYYLIISNDEENSRLAYTQLRLLWRRSAKTINFFKIERPSDPFNDKVDKQIEEWCTNDSISIWEGKVAIESLLEKTNLLFGYLEETSMENLDFWQIIYTDFLLKLRERNFTEPYIYFISDATFHTDVLDYIDRDGELFNEFRLWMEAQ